MFATRVLLLVSILLFYSTSSASTLVRLDKQNTYMSRVVIVSTDSGTTYKPVWAGIKEGAVDYTYSQYNFFCTEVRRPSRFKEVGAFTIVPAERRTAVMLSRVHDLGQASADAAAGMQIAIWELAEDTEIDLSSGVFRARPTIAVRWWAEGFLREAGKHRLGGSQTYVVAHPIYQNMIVLNYIPMPEGGRGGKRNGLIPYLPTPDGGGAQDHIHIVSTTSTLYLVLIGLVIMRLRR